MTPKLITSDRLILRPARPEDAAARLALGHSPEIRHMFGADPGTVRPMQPAEAEAWVAAQMKAPHAWIIETEGSLVGAARLHSIDPKDKRGVIALGLFDPALLGKGLGTEAIRLLSAHAFKDLGLHRLSARILDYNHRALAAFAKAGFREEGRERQAALVGGTRHDDVLMGLLAHEFGGQS